MKPVFTVLLTLISFSSLAQYHPTIRSGRPGQSIGPYATGKNIFQVQSGIAFQQQNVLIDGNANPRIDGRLTTFSENNVIRFGLLEWLEVSTLFDFVSQRGKVLSDDSVDMEGSGLGTFRGVQNFHLGGRINLRQQDGIIPAVGLQARFMLPVKFGGASSLVGVSVIGITQHQINEKWSMILNGEIRFYDKSFPVWTKYIMNHSVSVGEKTSVFAEFFTTSDEYRPMADGGIAYLVNPNFQLDASVGWIGTRDEPGYFIEAGISWRKN
jgi:hypothetical protein